jgi:hypothetical protein
MSEVVVTSTVEITPPTFTKEEIRKQKNRDYQREYMKKYYHERSAVDSDYLEKHRESARKAVAKQRAKYKEAFDFVKNNNISVKPNFKNPFYR